jgi:tetratricopeptide (TPR) repeat protein
VREGSGVDEDHDPGTPGVRSRRLGFRPDRVVVACLLVLLAFPVTAVLLGSRQPVVPEPVGELHAESASGQAGALRDLPVLANVNGVAGIASRAGRAELRGAVQRAIDELFDDGQAARLRRYLRRRPIVAPTGIPERGRTPPYPYRYVGLDALLDEALPSRPEPAQADRESDLGALLVLAADAHVLRNAGQVAYAILRRARAAGACNAQLNLAFLVAASDKAQAGDVELELGRADGACPRDPTALWLHGQWRSLTSQGDEPGTGRSLSAFARLQRRFPRSSAGWSGEADVVLRLAYIAEHRDQPFTAQSRFARALALYRRARSLDRVAELGAGEARALAGLRRYADAAAVQARAASASGRPAAMQARLIEYLERAARFTSAVREARRLAARPRFPNGPALTLRVATFDAALKAEDALEPLSAGAGRLKPAVLHIAPRAPDVESSGGPGPLEDFSFIPRFRLVSGVTDVERWCPDWSARRDLILAGRPREALVDMPDRFASVRSGRDDCDLLDASQLAAVAQAEAGHQRAAIGTMVKARRRWARTTTSIGQGASGSPGAAVYDARQNLWRFAGRPLVAAKVTAAWMTRAPRSPRAVDQAGEIAFLAGDHVGAARLFGTSARLTREQVAGWPVAEARDLVKQGAALKLAGRDGPALDALQAGADVAARALAAGDDAAADSLLDEADPALDEAGPDTASEPTFGEPDSAADALYDAHAQLADLLLRRHRFADAVDEYEAARDAGAGVPGVLDNNEAVAQIYRGDPRAGFRLAQRAVMVDPMNPLFLQTAGFALAHLHRPLQAAWRYGRAVASDPTLFPAWNDLGVMLARSGRDDAALAAFRRAVGVRRGYATAWFNLGLMLERRGLLHASAAQGALGRAFQLEPELAKREHRLITDERLYFTNLDLSKPLPPKWDFASSQQRSPLPAAGVALLLLLGLQGARAAGARGLTGGAPKWLAAARGLLARLPGALGSFAPSAVAVIATLAVFLWPAIRDDQDATAGLVLLALGLIALVTLVMRARVLVARRCGVTVAQRGWRPAILVAVAAAAVGIPWAPLPVAHSDRPEPRVHLIGPVVAAVCGLVLLTLSAWLDVPVTRSLGIAAIVMAASTLTPVKPLDGAQLEGASGVLTAGLAVGGTALLVALGLL